MGGTGSRGIALIVRGKKLCLEMMILEPSCSFSKLLSATTSPGLSPCTSVMLDLADSRLDVMDMGDAVLDQEDKRHVAVVLDGRGRDQDHVVQGFSSRRAFTNWLGKSALSLLSKMARSFSVPVVVSIWLSVASQLSRCQLGLFGAIERIDGQRLALAHLLLQLGSRCLPGW